MKFVKRIINRIKIIYFRIKWKSFKRNHLKGKSIGPNYLTIEDKAGLESKELRIQEIIKKFKPKNFLEIGIGGHPVVERLKLFKKMNISYTGCDFNWVCNSHKQAIKKEALSMEDISFLGNDKGTYSWNMFDLLESNKKFDMIYIDGHHTFYIDLPAFIISNSLLLEKGLLLVDDLSWTLEFVKKVMGRFFWEYYLYKEAYNFNEFTL